MATYETVEVNASNGTIERRALTDDEIRNGAIPYRVQLSSNKASIVNDGVDTATIAVQVVTAPLTDDSVENVALNALIDVRIDNELYSITTDNTGAETIALTSVDAPTTITVTVDRYTANELIIEVINAS